MLLLATILVCVLFTPPSLLTVSFLYLYKHCLKQCIQKIRNDENYKVHLDNLMFKVTCESQLCSSFGSWFQIAITNGKKAILVGGGSKCWHYIVQKPQHIQNTWLELSCRMIACSHEVRVCMNTGVTTRMCTVPRGPCRICSLANWTCRQTMCWHDMIDESAKAIKPRTKTVKESRFSLDSCHFYLAVHILCNYVKNYWCVVWMLLPNIVAGKQHHTSQMKHFQWSPHNL